MNKVIPVIILLIILAVSGGAIIYFQYVKSSFTKSPTVITRQKPSNVMFYSIKDAMAKSFNFECEYVDSSQKLTKVYIKSGAIRADSQNSSNSAEIDSMVMKNNKLYIWSNQQTQGTVIDFSVNNRSSTISGMINKQSTNSSSMLGENFIKDLEGQKEHCKQSVIAESLFILPTNITFLDLANMMQATNTGSPINYQMYMQSQQGKLQNK